MILNTKLIENISSKDATSSYLSSFRHGIRILFSSDDSVHVQSMCVQTVLLGLLTCMNCEFSFAGVGAGQVLCSAGVHAGVFGAGVEDNEGIFWVVVHKGEVAALREKHIILRQTDQLLIWFQITLIILPISGCAATPFFFFFF